jgi:hypothetical protein
MNSVAELHRAVLAAIAGKRLGKPVFVRYLLSGPDKSPAAARLARIVAAVRGWLGQALDTIHAVGSPTTGQVSLALRFREGGSALVSIARGKRLGDGVDLLVLGNHGALYHDAGHAALGAKPGKLPREQSDPALLSAVEKALRSGKPVSVKSEARS